MLQRVLEPEVMDSAEEARDYDAMDHEDVNRVFVADFLGVWNGNGLVLDVGTGTAQIPISLCSQSKTAKVIAVDLAENMLSLGRRNVEQAELSDRIDLLRVDAKKMVFEASHFDAVISNSIVHHIPEPHGVFAEMVRVAKPGGVLFVRDLLRPEDDATVRYLVKTYAGEANDHQQKMFEDSLRAALTVGEVRAIVADLGFPPATVRQTTDRHWTWDAIKPVESASLS
ncbi:MAG: class I SAM-dependent methyltransferase [Gemmataceae bacterium]